MVTPEEFMIFVVTAVPAAKVGVVRDKLNALEPLHMPKAMLQLIAKPQRRPVAVG